MPSVFDLWGELKFGTDDASRRIRAVDNDLSRLTSSLTNVERRSDRSSAVAARSFERVRERIAAVRASMDNAVSAFARGETNSRQLASALGSVERATGGVASRVRDMNARWTDFNARQGLTLANISKVGNGLRSMGQTLFTSVTLPLLGAGAGLLKAADNVFVLRNKLFAVTGTMEGANSKMSEFITLAKQNVGVTADMAAENYAFFKSIGVSEGRINGLITALGKLRTLAPDLPMEQIRTNLTQIYNESDIKDFRELLGKTPQIGPLLAKQFGATGATPDALQAAIKSGKENGTLTLEGWLQGFEEAINKSDQMSKLQDGFFARLGKMMMPLQVAFEPFGNSIMKAIEPGINALVPLVERLSAAFSALSPNLQLGIIGAAGFAAAIGPILVVIGSVISAITTIGGAISALGGLASIAPVLAIVGASLVTLAAYSAALYAAWQTNFGGIRDLVQAIGQSIQENWASAMSSISEITELVTAEAARFWSENGEDIKKAAKTVSEFIKSIWVPFVAFWKDNQQTILEITQGVWSVIKTWVVATVRQIGNALKLVTAIINGDWAKAWETLKDMVILAFRAAVAVAAGQAKMLVGAVKLAFIAVWNMNGWVIEQAAALGRAIGEGLINGLSSMGSVVSGYVSGFIAKNVISVAMSTLVINSPSKVFAEIGKGVGEGFILGLSTMEPDVQKAMAKLVTPKGIEKEIAKRIKDLQKSLSEALIGNQATSQGYGRTVGFEAELAKAERIKDVFNDLKAVRLEMATNVGKPLIAGPASEGELTRLTQIKDRFKELVDQFQASMTIDPGPLSRIISIFGNPEAIAYIEKQAAALGYQANMLKKLMLLSAFGQVRKDAGDDDERFGEGGGRRQTETTGRIGISEEEAAAEERAQYWKDFWEEIHNPVPAVNAIALLNAKWENFWGMLRTRMEEFKATLPSFKQALGENLGAALEGISSMLASNLTKWDGSFKNMFVNIAKGFADMAAQIAQEMLRLMIYKALLNLFGSIAGGIGGGASGGVGSANSALGGNWTIGGAISAGVRRASGGMVSGPGSATSDSILTRLSNGEFVMKAAAVRHWGSGLLSRMNDLTAGPTLALAGGGMVGGNSSTGSSYDYSQSFAPVFNIYAQGGSSSEQNRQTGRQIGQAAMDRMLELQRGRK